VNDSKGLFSKLFALVDELGSALFMNEQGHSGLDAGTRVLVQDAFQDGAVNQAVGLLQAFCASGGVSCVEYFLNGGAQGGFNVNIALAVAFCNVDPFFC
jgi:hypothetical protein